MILPIYAYGSPVLRATAERVAEDSAEIQQLIDDMVETMRGAEGAGLAGPQVGRGLRIFVADLEGTWNALAPEERPTIPSQPMVCINPELIYESEIKAEFEEGCLSIPGLYEKVRRPARITLRYLDRAFREQRIEGVGGTASVLQHERDHLDGVLHVDYLSPLRRRLIQKRLQRIARGDLDARYPMIARGKPAPVS